MNRREFVASSSMLALSSIFLSNQAEAAKVKKMGIQLYTLRAELEKDFLETIKQVSKIGYKFVEGYSTGKGNFFGYSAKDYNMILKDHGLKMPSLHTGTGRSTPEKTGTLLNGFEKLADECKSIGVEFIVCPYLDNSERSTIDNYKIATDLFNKSGRTCADRNLKFAYHNHAFEFDVLEGQVPYDVILSSSSSDLVKMELDLYWIAKAGLDPIDYFKKHPGRFPLWHVKDMDKSAEKTFTEVGNGTINFQRIFEQQKLAGLQYSYVEQDKCKGTPLTSIEISYKNLSKMRFEDSK